MKFPTWIVLSLLIMNLVGKLQPLVRSKQVTETEVAGIVLLMQPSHSYEWPTYMSGH